jgi:ectoine hydroxylase-related dioxygenase (phytanoyl-CoA dioxygenase family)
MTEPFRLTSAEMRRLNEDGYVVRGAVFTRAECAAMADAVEALERDLLRAKRRTKHAVGSYMFELQRELGTVVKWEPAHPDVMQGVEPFAHISAPLDTWARDPRLWNPSKDVIGQDDICLFTEKLTMKRARTGGSIVLHQDYPYWRPMTKVAHKVMTALIYLDDATIANGCLEVAPGSHRDGMVVERIAREGFGANEMDPAAYDTAALVPVEAEAGTVVFFGGFLVHRSLPNATDRDRRALLYSYQPAGYPHSLEITKLRDAKPVDGQGAAAA